MNQSTLANSIGFRHVLEDGLAILSKQDHSIDIDRKKYVLEDLVSFLSKAVEGLSISSEQSLFVGSSEKNAFEVYLLLKRYLAHDADWTNKLRLTESALCHLSQDVDVPADEQGAALELIENLLDRVRSQGLGVPLQPESISLDRKTFH